MYRALPLSFGSARIVLLFALLLLFGDAYATADDLVSYGKHIEGVLQQIVEGLRTILFFVLIIGLMWFVAMFVSGRPAVKPIVTVLVAAVMLGGIQVILNTFLDVDGNELKAPKDILQKGEAEP